MNDELLAEYLPRANTYDPSIPIEEQFRYHPPDEGRKVKHGKVNQAALDLALALKEAEDRLAAFMDIMDETLDSDPYACYVYETLSPLLNILRNQAYIFMVQQARMFTNKGIAMEDLLDKRMKKSEPDRIYDEQLYREADGGGV